MATDWTTSQIQVFLLEATEAMKALDWETVSQRAQAILALAPYPLRFGDAVTIAL